MDYREIIGSKFSEPAAVILYKEGDFRILEVNDGYIPELWMNVSLEEYIKKYPKECFDEENLNIFTDAVKRCVSSTTSEDVIVETWRQVFSDCCGYDKICLKSRLILIEKTEEGAVLYEGIRNISNEKRAQDTLEDIEYRYKNASEQINIYNWEYDIRTKEMRPCYRCMRDLGLPALVTNYPEPAIDAGIFPPDYADMYRGFMEKVDRGEKNLEVDIPLTVGRVPFRIKYTTEFDEEGNPVKAFGSATLISDTELGKIKLDNQIISRLAEEIPCIYLLDFTKDEFSIVKQEELMNFEADAKVSDVLSSVASKLDDTSDYEKKKLSDPGLLRSIMFKEGINREFVYKNETDNRWIRVEYHAVERGELSVDKVLLTLSVIDDYRAQKMNADRLIASQKKELEERQQMLLEAVDSANRANEAKTRFFSNVFDIIDMNRIGGEIKELEPSPVCLKELALSCVEIMQVKMDEQNINFRVNLDQMGEDIVLCDKLRFDQILLNLLSNAYKYNITDGSVFLDGRLLSRKDNLTYEIRVTDTGVGIDKDRLEHIFDEAPDGDSIKGGNRHGLSIVKEIITLMNGTIDVISDKGKGSEFRVLLPMKGQ